MDHDVKTEFGRCRRKECGGFTYSSTIDAERHLRHDHGLGTKDAVAPAGYTCKFEKAGLTCGQHFETRKLLTDHKKQENHINRKKVAEVEADPDEVQGGEDEAADRVEEA